MAKMPPAHSCSDVQQLKQIELQQSCSHPGGTRGGRRVRRRRLQRHWFEPNDHFHGHDSKRLFSLLREWSAEAANNSLVAAQQQVQEGTHAASLPYQPRVRSSFLENEDPEKPTGH